MANIKRLIISADDFGINAAANRNILKLARLGKVDRVGVLIDGKYTDKEIQQLLCSGVRIDLHLNVTEKKFPRLCENRKLISRSFKFLSRFISGKAGVGMTKLEWEKQLEKFLKVFKRPPEGFSSHEHVHFLPAYFKILTGLARSNGVSYVRLGEKGIIKRPNGVSQILNYLRQKNIRLFLESGLQSSDYFVSLDWLKNFDADQAEFPPGTIEIACHPERVRELKIASNLQR